MPLATSFSPATLEKFEAASASVPLRPLDRVFEDAGIRLGKDPGGPEGARRAQFRRYVATIDQRKPQQLGRLCNALAALIEEVAESKQEFLVKAAQRDGFIFEQGAFSPRKSAGSASVILASEPQIFVSDIEAACAFYLSKLGFTLHLSYGEPPFFAQIARDAGRLNMRKARGPVFDSGFRAREADALSATFTLDDAEPLYREFEKAGVTFHQTLRTEPWGARTFIIRDPDGNLIGFAGD